jgi:hypothetical protein
LGEVSSREDLRKPLPVGISIKGGLKELIAGRVFWKVTFVENLDHWYSTIVWAGFQAIIARSGKG